MKRGRKRKLPYDYIPPTWNLSDSDPNDLHEDLQHPHPHPQVGVGRPESTESEMEVEPEPDYYSDREIKTTSGTIAPSMSLTVSNAPSRTLSAAAANSSINEDHDEANDLDNEEVEEEDLAEAEAMEEHHDEFEEHSDGVEDHDDDDGDHGDDVDEDEEVRPNIANYEHILSELSKEWVLLEMKHRISKSASQELWNTSKKWFPLLTNAMALNDKKKKIPQIRTLREKMTKTHVPNIQLEVGYEVKETGDVIILRDIESIPIKKFPPNKFLKLYESASVEISDILKIHEERCSCVDNNRLVQISSDGLSESRSTTNSLDVYSLRFNNCSVVYPHTIVRPSNNYKFKYRPCLQKFLNDLIANHCTITAFIGDNLKRAHAREALNHASLFGCEYCFGRATSFKKCSSNLTKKIEDLEKQINTISDEISKKENSDDIAPLVCVQQTLKKSLKELSNQRSHVVWPSSTLDQEPRTKEKVLEIVKLIEENPNISKEEKKGIKGKSPLLEIEHFNFVKNIPTEYLHCVCLGNCKRMIELTFNVGVVRHRITKRRLSSPEQYNQLMNGIKVVCEFSRRVRALDFSVMKGQEFRNIVLFFFPVVIECIETNCKERKLWLLFSYMIRSCILPSNEFKLLQLEIIKSCCKEFYCLYEELFSAKNCTYNMHSMLSHLIDMRYQGPLTYTSAFGFENFYGEIRNSFVPGTPTTVKQIMKKTLLRRSLMKHSCHPTIKYSNYETALERNNLIYTYKHDQYIFYKIVKVSDNQLHCVEIDKKKHKFKETPTLKWETVGVFKYDKQGEKKDIKLIDPTAVGGKLIQVKELLITCPINVLEEK